MRDEITQKRRKTKQIGRERGGEEEEEEGGEGDGKCNLQNLGTLSLSRALAIACFLSFYFYLLFLFFCLQLHANDPSPFLCSLFSMGFFFFFLISIVTTVMTGIQKILAVIADISPIFAIQTTTASISSRNNISLRSWSISLRIGRYVMVSTVVLNHACRPKTTSEISAMSLYHSAQFCFVLVEMVENFRFAQ